jgi:hypothetical protein
MNSKIIKIDDSKEILISPDLATKNENDLNTVLSEPALAKDWLNKEDEEAWKNL